METGESFVEVSFISPLVESSRRLREETGYGVEAEDA